MNFKNISVIIACLLICLFGTGDSTQTFDAKKIEGNTFWTLDKDSKLETLNVYKVVDVIETDGPNKKTKFELKVNEQELEKWKQDAEKQGIDPSELIHTITVFGHHKACRKKTALKAAVSAFVVNPNGFQNEKLFNIDFESKNVSYKDGVFITTPYKRYNKWFVHEYPRYFKGGNLGVDARLISAALQRSSGAVYFTNQRDFQSDRSENIASGLILMNDIDAKSNIPKLPLVGFRRGPKENSTFQDEFLNIEYLREDAKTLKNENEILMQTYKWLDYQVYRDGDFGSSCDRQFDKSPFDVFIKHENDYGAREYDLVKNYGNYVKIIGDLMLTVSDDSNRRVVTLDGFQSLLRKTIPWLNSMSLDSKKQWELIAGDLCQDTTNAIIDSEKKHILSEMMKGCNINNPQNPQDIEIKKNRLRAQCLGKLQSAVSVMWPTIQKQCTEAFDQQFTSMINVIDKQRLTKQMFLERNARIALESQLNSINFLFQYWKEILISIAGCWIGWKLLKFLKCCSDLCGTSSKSADKKLVTRLEQVLDEKVGASIIKETDDNDDVTVTVNK